MNNFSFLCDQNKINLTNSNLITASGFEYFAVRTFHTNDKKHLESIRLSHKYEVIFMQKFKVSSVNISEKTQKNCITVPPTFIY